MDEKTEERIKKLEEEVERLKTTPPTVIVIQPAPQPPPVYYYYYPPGMPYWPYPYNGPQITWSQPSITICNAAAGYSLGTFAQL